MVELFVQGDFMKLILNNILKGLLVALLVISLGGLLYINISKPEEINLQLITSSVVNQIGTESKNVKETKKENNDNKKLVEDKIEENKEDQVAEDKKEDIKTEEEKEELPKEEVKEEEKVETKEETNQDTSSNTDVTESQQDNSTTPEEKQEEPKQEEEKVPKTETEAVEAVTQPEEAPQNNQSSNTNPKETTTGPYAPNMTAVNGAGVKRSWSGNMTAYGPDCVGCGGMVAHGEYVGSGRIYYNDPTFGTIRIVAGDRDVLSIGSIVRIKGLKNFSEPVIAIMLDTGGAIKASNNIYFDLLYESESAASGFGRPGATYEILREGF